MTSPKVQVPVRTGPSGSIVIWLAGLVFGVSAGLLLVYHFLMASRTNSAVSIDVAQAAPIAQPQQAKLAAAHDVSSAHSEAMKAALKPETR